MVADRFLATGCVMLAVFHIVCTSPPSSRLQNIRDVSQLTEVFRVVAEKSCSCKWFFLACNVEIMQEKLQMGLGTPCPPNTRYCCQKETIVTLSDLIKKMSANQSKDANDTTTEVSFKTHTTSSGLPIITSDVQVTPSGDAAPVIDATVATSKSPSTGCLDSETEKENFNCPPTLKNTNLHLDTSLGTSQDTSITASEVPAGSNVVLKPDISQKEEASSPRKPKMIACSCTTKEECESSWSFFQDLPEVKFRTTIKCEGLNEIICCLGKVMPPRKHKSKRPTGGQGFGSRPSMINRTRWRPSLRKTWQSIVSWFSW